MFDINCCKLFCLYLIPTVKFPFKSEINCCNLFCSVLICSILVCSVLISSVLVCSDLVCTVLEVKLTYSMDRTCKACGKRVHKNKYLKHRTVCKNCYNKNRRKNKKSRLNQKWATQSPPKKKCFSQRQPKLIVTTPIFQHMKTIDVLLLVQAMLLKPIIC